MKNRFLMPRRFKKIGCFIFAITTIVFLGYLKFEWRPAMLTFTHSENSAFNEVNLLPEVIFTFWMVGLIMIAFSKEKHEDEYISYLRLSSWQYSVLVSFVISIIGTWSIYGVNYLIFSAFNMLAVPLAFITIFNVSNYLTTRRSLANEK